MAYAPAAVAPVDRCIGTTGRTVVVDLSDQQMWLCRHAATVTSSPVTTGSDAHATPTGRWSVYAKETSRWLSGEGYSRQVDYWMPFSEGFGFHDSAWQTIPYGSARVHAKGSHGCVHVPAPMMNRLYRWADVGTKVRITA
jgi:lipoprotein-anchoring transpeptidase ErfK/SrfK